MRIPLVDLRANYQSIKSEVDTAIAEILENASFIMGAPVQEFDERWAEYCGARFAVGLASGSEAVRLALKACDLGPGAEVITTANTFIATTEAISANGATPVFVDIDDETFGIDVGKISSSVSRRTRAIVCVHLYGHACDMDPIMELARDRDLTVIEDCAQCHGGRYKGRMLGTIGRVGCFSMFPAKVLGAYGDAGAIITDDEVIAERVQRYRDHGRISKYESVVEGYNARMDALQAKILCAKLPHLPSWIDKRRERAARYNETLGSLLRVPTEREWAFHPYYLYVVRTEQRDELKEYLAGRGISCGVHYPIPLHLQQAYEHLGYRQGSLPRTEQACSEILSLPLYPELTIDQQDYVIHAVRSFFSNGHQR